MPTDFAKSAFGTPLCSSKESSEKEHTQNERQNIDNYLYETHNVLVPLETENRSVPPLSLNLIPRLYRIFFAFLFVLQFFTLAHAADLGVRIQIKDADPSIRVSIEFDKGSKIANRRSIGFLNRAVGADGLARRITSIKFFDQSGNEIAGKKMAIGEWLADVDVSRIDYVLDLAPFKDVRAAAHASWLNSSNAVLMLDDILPQLTAEGTPATANVAFEIPAEWAVFGENLADGKANAEIVDRTKAVFYLGKGLRKQTVELEDLDLSLVISGNWHFTDAEAAGFAKEIMLDLEKTFTSFSGKAATIGIMRFPTSVTHGNWEAETRGNTVTIISSDMPFRTQSIQRLHEQLRHELFHLWIPNGVNLTGNYAWFYEGFALYNSLKMAVRTKRIRFDDMLDTLSRAAAIDARQRPRLPLVPDSGNAASDTSVYARGMLIAFLLDIQLIETGRTTLTDEMRGFFLKYRVPGTEISGNSAAFGLFPKREIRDKYVMGAESFDLGDVARRTGLFVDQADGQFKIPGKLTRAQRAALAELSYNTWRSSTRIVTR